MNCTYWCVYMSRRVGMYIHTMYIHAYLLFSLCSERFRRWKEAVKYTPSQHSDQAVLLPHSQPASSQVLNQQPHTLSTSHTSTLSFAQENMPSQQQQPCPPSERAEQGSPLSGQLTGAPKPQLQVVTPSQLTVPKQPPQGITLFSVSPLCVQYT